MSCAEKKRRSDRATMARGPLRGAGTGYSPITAPSGDFRPILLARFSAADLARLGFREPQVPIRPQHDPVRPSARCRNRELGDDAGWRDPADLVGSILAEPQVPVGTGNDPSPRAIRLGELNKTAIGRIEPPDLRGPALAESETAVRTSRDDKGPIGRRNLVQNDLDIR
jgi:hypothetical protein